MFPLTNKLRDSKVLASSISLFKLNKITLPTSQHRNSQFQKSSYIFPHYFRIYFNLLFVLLLSPVWVSFGKNSVQFRRHLLQKIPCFILSGMLITVQVLSIRRKYTGEVKDNPQIIFHLFSHLIWACYIIIIVSTVWLKQTTIQFILEIPRRSATIKDIIKGIAISAIGPILALIFHLVFTDLDKNLEPLQIWDNYARQVLNMFAFKNNRSEHVEFSNLDLTKQILVRSVFILDFVNSFVIHMFEIFVLISSIAAYELVSDLTAEYKMNVHCLMIVLDRFAEMKLNIGRINDVNGIFLLATFIQIISYVSSTLIDVFDEAWQYKILFIEGYIFYSILLGYAAEANFKAHGLKKYIFQKQLKEMNSTQTVQSKGCHKYKCVKTFLKATAGQTGLTGGRFFLITYSLLGTTFSILFTYAIVMVQFQATPKDNHPSCSCKL